MSERPPVVVHGVELSAEDADAIERDTFLYGNAYVEVTEDNPFRKRGRRIDPTTVIAVHRQPSSA